MIITKQIQQQLGLTDLQVIELNKMLAFITVKSVGELTSILNPVNGNMIFEGEDGSLYKVPINTFYQLIGGLAKPIKPSDSAPTVIGWYKPTEYSADPGTNYPNLGNLKAKKGFDTLFYFDGTNWVEIVNEMPKSSPNLRKWENLTASDFPLTYSAQVVKDDTIWILKDGESATINDVPGESDKWVNEKSNILEYLQQDFWNENGSETINLNTELTSKHWVNDSGVIQQNSSNAWDFSSGFIPLEENETIKYKAIVYPDANAVSFYDENKNFITGIKGISQNEIVEGIVKPLSNYKYVVFYTTNYNGVMGNNDNFAFIKYGVDSKAKKINEILSPLYDLKREVKGAIIGSLEATEAGYYDTSLTFHPENSIIRGFHFNRTSEMKRLKINGLSFNSGSDDYPTLFSVNSANAATILIPRGNTVLNDFIVTIPNDAKKIYGTLMLGGATPKIEMLSDLPTVEDVPNVEKLETFIKSISGDNVNYSVGSKLAIGKPKSLIKIEFKTKDAIPDAKGTKMSGEIDLTFDNIKIKKFAKLEVQGTSSQFLPKKNWSIALFNDEDFSDSFKLSINGLVYQDEFVYKANYIDASHMRNILGNRLWEQFIQSRKGFPKREFNEVVYTASNGNFADRFPTRAIGHVDGFPCEIYINDGFYGIGNFNIGKKRDNYNLKKSNKKNIQLEDGIDGQRNLITWKGADWNVRNPEMSGYVEGGEITDNNVKASVDRLFAYHGSDANAMVANFEQYYNKQNIFDKIIFSQAIYDLDGIAKNYMLTTWNGNIWHHLPYDLDSIFGLNYDGNSYFPSNKDVFTHYQNVGGDEQSAFLSGRNFYRAILNGYKTEINARYQYLRANNILTVDNLYNQMMEMYMLFGDESFDKEQKRWNNLPSNTAVYTSISQILKYMEERFVFLDFYFS